MSVLNLSDIDEKDQQDICRVCRSEGSPERPLFHPCICTGSIKFIHQECLVQWLRYSRKEYCELCNHRFSFTPIYSPDMPQRLSIKDILSGLISSVVTVVKSWCHYTLVFLAWLVFVPLIAYRIYKCLFTGSVSSILTLPLDLLSVDHLLTDILSGCIVVVFTLCGFISLVWLREQILHGGGPDWLEPEQANPEPGLQVEINEVANENAQIIDEVQPNNADLAGNDNINNNDNLAQDGNNWNPMEWDRGPEELTWERLLGLDGSLLFIEHVFWVVSLNTFFILVFAFCPYHFGHFTITTLKLQEAVNTSHFEGLFTTLCGYCVIGMVLVLFHTFASILNFKKLQRFLGLCYVIVKVCLLSVVEIGVFPLVSGCWLDVCSLKLFDATLKDRIESFKQAPWTSMFLHWLAGMVYVFYFALFVLLLREVLRPGVLWFLRNLNDPDFNPIQEMIQLPILSHIRRFLVSMVIFGTTILLMLWIPVSLIDHFWPNFLPYVIDLTSEFVVPELTLELILLELVLPKLLETTHMRICFKNFVKFWCICISWVLDLRSYLLGDVLIGPEDEKIEYNPAGQDHAYFQEPPPQPEPQPPAAGWGLGAAHQALLQRDGPIGFKPYKRPKMFALRIFILFWCMSITICVSSLVTLTVPVYVGRQVMYFMVGSVKVHEIYTGAFGFYLSWLMIRAISIVASWVPNGWAAVLELLKKWAIIGFKVFVASAILIGIVPLMVGVLIDHVFVPAKVNLFQTPIIFLWQDWVQGLLFTKILRAIIMVFPTFRFRQVIEQVLNNGVENIHLTFILQELAMPIIIALGLALSVPYVLSQSIIPLFITTTFVKWMIHRWIYPCIVVISMATAVVVFQTMQFKTLYEHIKNERYLVGRRLVNYDPQVANSVLIQNNNHEN